MSFDDTAVELRDRFESATYDRPVEDVYAALQSRHRRRQGAGIAAVTAVAAAALVVWQPFGQAQGAIAGWTPEPQPADEALVAEADAHCRGGLTMLGALESLPAVEELAWSDQRGNGMVLVYQTNTEDTLGVCLMVDLGKGFRGDGGSGFDELGPLTGVLRVDAINGFDIHQDNIGVTAVLGQAAPEVSRITVTAPGWIADASQHDGYWLAWWPTVTDASQITVDAYNEANELLDTYTWSP